MSEQQRQPLEDHELRHREGTVLHDGDEFDTHVGNPNRHSLEMGQALRLVHDAYRTAPDPEHEQQDSISEQSRRYIGGVGTTLSAVRGETKAA